MRAPLIDRDPGDETDTLFDPATTLLPPASRAAQPHPQCAGGQQTEITADSQANDPARAYTARNSHEQTHSPTRKEGQHEDTQSSKGKR